MYSLYRLWHVLFWMDTWQGYIQPVDGLETYFLISMLMCQNFFPSNNMTFKISLHVLSYGIFKGLEQVDGHQILPLMERNALIVCLFLEYESLLILWVWLLSIPLHLWASTSSDAIGSSMYFELQGVPLIIIRIPFSTLLHICKFSRVFVYIPYSCWLCA